MLPLLPSVNLGVVNASIKGNNREFCDLRERIKLREKRSKKLVRNGARLIDGDRDLGGASGLLTRVNVLKTLVDTRWSELSFEAPWVNEAQRAIADTLVTGLSDYLTRAEQGGLEEVLHEQRLRITISDGGADGVTATIGGRIDRIERHADGTATIVDFKTGAKAKSDADTQENLQLRAYQYGLVNGGVVRRVDSDGITVPFHAENAGAKLVFPAVPSTPKGGSPLEYTENVQAVSDDTAHAEFAAAIMEAARGMHQSVFTGPRVGRDFAGSLDPNKVWVRIPEVSAHE
jgi:RecB family exonuclease